MQKERIKEYLDDMMAIIEKENPCTNIFVVYKTKPPYDEIVGMPLAIFGTREGLYRNFQSITEKLDERWGISVQGWKFDD